MDVYVYKKDIPKRCLECLFINRDDACILQTDEDNVFAETWDDLKANCPLKSVESILNGGNEDGKSKM